MPRRPSDPCPRRAAAAMRALGWAAACALCAAGCQAFQVNVGTDEPIKLDPIKVDLTMRVDTYIYDGKSDEEQKQEAANREDATKRIYDRMAEVQELKNNRLVGENHLGLLSIRNLPAGDYGEYVQRTVDAENADRAFLMTDISNRSDDSLAAVRRDQWQKRVAASFEGEWIEEEADSPGTYRWVAKEG